MSPDTVRLIIEIGTFLGGLLFGGWKLLEVINKRIENQRIELNSDMKTFIQLQDDKMKRVFDRMDDRAEEAEKTYVRMDIHNLTIEHINQKTDDKFNNIVDKFEMKLAELTKAVNKLVSSDERRSEIK